MAVKCSNGKPVEPKKDEDPFEFNHSVHFTFTLEKQCYKKAKDKKKRKDK